MSWALAFAGFAWLGFWRCVVGATAGIIMVLSLALIAATAPAARRPVAASFVFAGVGLAILSAGTLVPLLLRLGLSAAWLGLGGCAIGAAAAAIWGWRAAPVQHAPPVARPTMGPATGTASPWNLSLRLLLLGHFCFSMAIVPHTLYWVDYIARGLG